MKRTSSDNWQLGRAVWWDSFFLGLLILAMCTQMDVRQIGRDTLAEGLGYATKTLKVAVPDVALLWTFLWFVGRTTYLKAWRRLWWPPLACWALIAAMIISALHSETIITSVGDALAKSHGVTGLIKGMITKESKEAIAEIIQYGLYFVIAPWLFVNLIHDRRHSEIISRRKFALGTFAIAITGVLLIGLVQLASFREASPRALWGSPNLYGCFLATCLVFPPLIASSYVSSEKKNWLLPAILIFGVFCATTIASMWALVGSIISIVFLLLFSHWKPGKLVAAMLLVGIAIGIFRTVPAVHSQRLEFLRVNSSTQAVKKQYVEWYAAMGWAIPRERSFATGVGPGNYQLNIGPYYGSLPNEEKMPPDSNNLYLVQAVSIGVLGLGTLLWIIGHFMRLAWLARRQNSNDWLAVGVLASMTCWLFVNLFHATIVRGAGIVLAFILSLAVIALLQNSPVQMGEVVDANLTQPEASEDVITDEEKI